MSDDASIDDLPHPIRAGIKAALGAPALGLFVSLMGYGAMNKGIGMDFAVMWSAVFLIWSMPALMTFSELALTGTGLWAMFVAVMFSNLRNIPMVVTALPLIRTERGLRWKDLLFAQLLAPTVWVLVLVRAQNQPLNARRAFFTAFALTVFISALVGATVGYFGLDAIPATLGTAMFILTPLYLLLIMVSVRKLSGYLSLGLGALSVPWLMQWSVEWGLAIGGVGAGTLGFLIGGGYKRQRKI